MGLKRAMVFLTGALSVVGVGKMLFHSQVIDGQPLNNNVATPEEAPIPKEALRLRIVANSNSTTDQTLKREVRNAVVRQVGVWLQGVKTADQAREILIEKTPAIQAMAADIVRSKGFSYGVQTEIKAVPFPTKIYGNRVYPAGNYEALRIVLGDGQGANWWCVLFPPLCFVDIAEGEAVPSTGGFPDMPALGTVQVPNAEGGTSPVQVRLASVDYGEEMWHTVKGLFAQKPLLQPVKP